MPEYLSPGVYIQEVDSGPRPIEGVGTAMAAFVGFAAAGPTNRPELITNWSQYVNTFGRLEEGGQRNPHVPGAYLSHAVYGHFLNGGGRALAERAPEVGNYLLKAPPMTKLPQVQSRHFQGDVAERSGLEGLEVAEDVTMVCCPDLMAAYQAGALDRDGVKAVQLAMIAHCERMGDRVAILDALPDLSPQAVKRWREQETNYDSKYAVLYYPWLKVAGNGRPLKVPPSGHMAGIYARNDNERGVHKAPANEVIRGAMEAVTQITKGEQDTLNPIGVNCIRSFTGRGLRVWGARTLSSDPAWRYVNVRRLFNYVEKSIEHGTQWVVFEPNDYELWARVKRDVGAFLTGAWRGGMLFGRSPEEAFFVKCDEENNPQDVRDRGQLFIDIGMAPVKPAEFVVFRLSQWAAGGA